MRKWMICGTAAAAVAFGAGSIAAAGASAATRGDTITFEATSDTTFGTISYFNGADILHQQHDFKLSEKGADGLYHRTISFPSVSPQQILSLRVQSEGSTAKCVIKVNGKVHSRGVAHGFRASALCT